MRAYLLPTALGLDSVFPGFCLLLLQNVASYVCCIAMHGFSFAVILPLLLLALGAFIRTRSAAAVAYTSTAAAAIR